MSHNPNSPRIAVVTVADDLHSHVIRKTLRDRHGCDLILLESDRIARSGALSWSPDGPALVPDSEGNLIDVSALDVVWWRRPSGKSWDRNDTWLADIRNPAALDVIRNDCRAAFQGMMQAAFNGRWLSSPEATRRAEHKVLQLQVAQKVGLRVPKTLISQDPDAIRAFCRAQETVVKAVSGTALTPLIARVVTPDMLEQTESLRLSPAIWQECIDGYRHLRVHAFGEQFVAAHMTCPELDWRIHLDQVEIDRFDLPGALENQLRAFMRQLGLTMGIFDLKIDRNGLIWFLEVNPQGQFLFVEGMGDIPLAEIFADHLMREGLGQLALAA